MTAEGIAAICELVGIASLCSWTVCISAGVGLCAPDRALLLGVPGTLLGGVWFEYLGLATGPTVGGYPVVPGLLGTAFMLVVTSYVKRIREDIQAREEAAARPPLREWTTAHQRAR